jgi:tRNA A-37 threonylcarbamoyl transferase component Bud32
MTWKTIPLFRSRRRAERFWLGAWGLRARGLPAPACYGMWRPNLLSRAATSGVVMEMVPGESLRDLLLTMGDKRDALRPVSLKLAQLLAKMHDKGVFHRDLKASNLLVGQVQGREEIFLMDLEDVSFEKRVSVKEVIRNLTQLDQSSPRWVSRFTKLRFLATYLGARSKGRELDELLGVLRSGKNTER